jgi:hypothetical protein
LEHSWIRESFRVTSKDGAAQKRLLVQQEKKAELHGDVNYVSVPRLPQLQIPNPMSQPAQASSQQ